MQVLEFFTKKKNQQIQAVSFAPTIRVSPNSTLYVECTPDEAHTASNITINSYPSKTNLTLLQTRIQWRRFKIISDTQHTNTNLPFITGNTYQCQPADLGYYIQAKIISYDVACNGSAEVTIGPIKLDYNVKQLIEGALYSRSLRSQVKVLERNQARNIDMILTDKLIKFTDEISNKQLQMPYDMQQPKIQVNPKDPVKIFLRFGKDDEGKVQQWLDSLFQQNKSFEDQSKRSMYSQGSSNSSRKIFRGAGSVSKIQISFLTRHTRDQFIFALRAFVCKQQIKNTAAMQIITNVSQLRTQADAHKFFQFMSIKLQLYRLAQLAKRFEQQLNNKIKDVNNLEQLIMETTTAYTLLLNNTAKQLKIDLNQSYAENSMRMEQVMGKKQIKELQLENQRLKERVRELVEENQLFTYFEQKKNNQSMLNQTSNNPFSKKQNNDSYYGPSMAYENEVPPINQNVASLTKSYLNLLTENQRLKQQRKHSIIVSNNPNTSKDNDLEQILTSMNKEDEPQKIKALERENKNLKQKLQQMSESLRKSNVSRQVVKLNQSVAYQNQEKKDKSIISPQQQSYVQRNDRSYVSRQDKSAIDRLQRSYADMSQSNLNDSMTSEAALMALENKVRQIGLKNKEILSENDRLRGQRDKYRSQYEKLKKTSGNVTSSPIDHRSVMSNSNYFDPEGLKQQNENLINEKNSLLRKIESLTRQSLSGDKLLQRKCQQLTKQNNNLKKENDNLRQQIQVLKQTIKQKRTSSQSNSQNNRQTERLKKINMDLLQEMRNLKLQLQKKNSPLYNSRVIELQNQVSYLKKAGNIGESSQATKDLLNKISQLQKEVQRLTRQNNDKKATITYQTSVIQRFMNSNEQNSRSISGKDKSYSQTRNDSQSNQKLKKKIKQLQEQIVMMRRSADALNRSQDISRDMYSIHEEKISSYKEEIQKLYQQNQNLGLIVKKYAKQMQESQKQLQKWKQKAFDLMKQQQQPMQ